MPDFSPQWTARKGAKQLYEAYRRVGLTLDEFEGSRYQRIGHIRMLMDEGVLDAKLRFRREPATTYAGPAGPKEP